MFSPKFRDKTWLTGAKVRAFIAAQPGADVYTFSPTPDEACCHAHAENPASPLHERLCAVTRYRTPVQ